MITFEQFASKTESERIAFVSAIVGEGLVGDAPISPATSIAFVIDYDADGWPIWEGWNFGDVVIGRGGSLAWRIVGFRKDDTVLLSPHGLGHDPMIAGCSARPESLEGLGEPEPVFRHRDGLVSLG